MARDLNVLYRLQRFQVPSFRARPPRTIRFLLFIRLSLTLNQPAAPVHLGNCRGLERLM